jgi:4-hydroxy-tetrahydrodipicolinate synthase
MMYNNPATSGVDMSPELLVRIFDAIDNISMVKESTGDLSRMQRIDQLSGGRLPFYNGSNPLVLDALRAGAARMGARPHRVCAHSPASTCTMPYAEANFQERKPFTPSSSPAGVHRGKRAGHHGQGRVGVSCCRSWGSGRPLLPLDDEGRVVLQRLLTNVQ